MKTNWVAVGVTVLIAVFGFLGVNYLDNFVTKAEYNEDVSKIEVELEYIKRGQHEIKELIRGR